MSATTCCGAVWPCPVCGRVLLTDFGTATRQRYEFRTSPSLTSVSITWTPKAEGRSIFCRLFLCARQPEHFNACSHYRARRGQRGHRSKR